LSTTVRVGTCSWADKSLVAHWYPKGVKSAEERLRYYIEHFDAVEADSPYYRLPEEPMVARWAERTPEGFVMHVKAFGLMTRHPVKLEQLPPELREPMPVDDRGRVNRPSRELRAVVFRRFREALEPLRSSGKLGGILLQFPSYVVVKPVSFDYLEWAAGQLEGEHLLVEFRHSSWLAEENRAETLRFLEKLGATHVITDSPRIEGARNVMPTVVAATSPIVYVRLHGRNAATWNKRGGSAAERFDYLYSDDELREWVPTLRELAGEAEQLYVMFNNNGRTQDADGNWIAQAPVNGLSLRRILEQEGVPVAGPAVQATA
jgi:uncharacterized protein YecE (DUF72 family)